MISEEQINLVLTNFRNTENIDSKHNNWLTNANIGLLGYFVALLVQLKIAADSSKLPLKWYAFIIILQLCLNIGFGLAHKFLYEKNLSDSISTKLLKSVKVLIKQSKDKPQKEKDKILDELDGMIKNYNNGSERSSLKTTPGFIKCKLISFSISIVLIIGYYSIFLFL